MILLAVGGGGAGHAVDGNGDIGGAGVGGGEDDGNGDIGLPPHGRLVGTSSDPARHPPHIAHCRHHNPHCTTHIAHYLLTHAM